MHSQHITRMQGSSGQPTHLASTCIKASFRQQDDAKAMPKIKSSCATSQVRGEIPEQPRMPLGDADVAMAWSHFTTAGDRTAVLIPTRKAH